MAGWPAPGQDDGGAGGQQRDTNGGTGHQAEPEDREQHGRAGSELRKQAGDRDGGPAAGAAAPPHKVAGNREQVDGGQPPTTGTASGAGRRDRLSSRQAIAEDMEEAAQRGADDGEVHGREDGAQAISDG